jgi:serine/threonine-protein kinase RsbW
MEFPEMPQTLDQAVPQSVPQLSPFVEFQQSLASRVEDVSPFVGRLMQIIKRLTGTLGDQDAKQIELEVALVEAVANAVIHGNRRDPQKRVYVTCRINSDGEVLLTIRDEGQGFDIHAVPDPLTQENLLRTHGRGIRLMQALMDEVEFEQGGKVVRMRKRLRSRVSDNPARPARSPSEDLCTGARLEARSGESSQMRC